MTLSYFRKIHELKVDSNLIYELVDGKPVYHSHCPVLQDGNQGLPEWFFEGAYVTIQLFVAGVLDWTPSMGPAPCWTDKLLAEDTVDSISERWIKWFDETYGW